MNRTAKPDCTMQKQITYKNPLVSVIIPSYNRATLLLETLASVQSQPYRPLQIIIVNDGSTDDTQKKAHQWVEKQKSDPGLKFHLIQQENCGAAAARNNGKRQATGRYIHFLDSDDLVGPHFYTKIVAIMEKEVDCAFAWGDWTSSENASTAVTQLPDPRLVLPVPSLTPHNSAWCGIFRASMVPSTLTWNVSLKNHNDWDYTTRFLLSNPKLLLHFPAPLLVYRTHTGLERLGRIRTRDSLAAALHAVDHNASLFNAENAYARTLAVRFSTEYITLLFGAMEIHARKLQIQAARGVFKHATLKQSWFWNLVAATLICLLPVSGTVLGRQALKLIRRRFGDMQLTTDNTREVK